MYENIPASYPATFFYNLSKLSGSLSKNLIKVTADRTDASPSTITNIRLPIGALLNLDSFALFFKVSMSGSNPTIPARYASSFVKRLSLSINNTNAAIINDYNLVYNIYADCNNKHYSKGVGGEWLDNSILWTEGAGASDQVAIAGASSLLASTANQTNMQFCINNWLGLLGSASTKILPTSLTGEIVLSVEWAPNYEVLGGTGESTTATYTASDTYSISDIYCNVEAMSFSDDMYYNSIMDKELKIGFNDYVVTKFASVQKKSGINVTTYISANSVDHVLGTAIIPQTLPKPMVAYGSLGTGATESVVANMFKYLSDPVAYADNASTTAADNVYGDGFFSTIALQRCLQHITDSQFSINNKALNYAPLNPYEIFQNNLNALGYEGVDASANGMHSGVVSLLHFYKYYGFCMQSLELIDKDQFYISGLSSAGSSCAINWTANFSGASNTLSVVPVIIAKLSKVLHVGKGRAISIE